jgi:carboxylesterase type B
MIGINANEPVSFLNYLFHTRPLSPEIYIGAVGLLFGQFAAELLTLYPVMDDNRDLFVKIEQDAIFNCGSKRLLRNSGFSQTYMYIFHAVSTKSYNHWSKEKVQK